MRRTALGRYFDQVVCAHSLGVPKEDTRFWRELPRGSPFEAKSTLLVDDSVPVLRAARAFGLRHVVAVGRPDSGAPSKRIDEFACIDRVDEISGDAVVMG